MESNRFLLRLEKIKEKYELIQKDLLMPDISTDDLIQKQKELSELQDIYVLFEKYSKYNKARNDSFELTKTEDDQELLELLKEEIKDLDYKLLSIEKELKYLLLPKDKNDEKNIIVEIKGAVGGDEANLFAADLYRMYLRYVEKRGYKTELVEMNQTEGSMFSKVEFIIKGKGAYSRLKYESGVHRVQRVPETEAQGRVHTSTATVYVMPQADDVDIKIDPQDIKIDAFYSSGAGGQSVNTTMSAVRITHIPTGIVVTCQNERSQIQNKEKALLSLRSRLYQKRLQELEEQEGKLKNSSIGAGMRAEKIRTYNYPQNRVSDHRYNITVKNLDEIINGNLDLIIDPLLDSIKTEELENANE